MSKSNSYVPQLLKQRYQNKGLKLKYGNTSVCMDLFNIPYNWQYFLIKFDFVIFIMHVWEWQANFLFYLSSDYLTVTLERDKDEKTPR